MMLDPYLDTTHAKRLHRDRRALLTKKWSHGLDEIESVRLRAIEFELDCIDDESPLARRLDMIAARLRHAQGAW
jgi:hypothetical protein